MSDDGTTDDPTGGDTTLRDVRPVRLVPRPVLAKRLLVALLAAVVVAGAGGLFGVRSTESTASARAGPSP